MGAASPSPSVGGSGERCKLPQRGSGGAPENLHFGTFWDLRNRQNGQLAFESGGGGGNK